MGLFGSTHSIPLPRGAVNSEDGKNPPSELLCGLKSNVFNKDCVRAKEKCNDGLGIVAAFAQASRSKASNSSCPANYTDSGVVTVNRYCNKAPGHAKSCKIDRYDDPTDKAKCYAGKMPKGESQRVDLGFNDRHGYINNLGKCPSDYEDPAAANQYLTSYCSEWGNISGDICQQWWNEDPSRKPLLDKRYRDLCADPKYRDDKKCACINAKASWTEREAYKFPWCLTNNPCGDPKNGAFKTSDMYCPGVRDCRQFWDTRNINDSTITNNEMNQYCTMKFPDNAPVDPAPFDPDENDQQSPPGHHPTAHPSDRSQDNDSANTLDNLNSLDAMLEQNVYNIPVFILLIFFLVIVIIALLFVRRGKNTVPETTYSQPFEGSIYD